MPSIGQILRQARTERGLDLDEIGKQIRINPKYLLAIESDRPRNVPGGFFYKSFVRQYADALGVDSDEIDEALAAVEIREEPMPMALQDDAILRDIRPMPQPSGRSFTAGRLLPSIGILAAVMFVCSAFYSWWHRIQAASAVKSAEISRVLPEPVTKKSAARASAPRPSQPAPPQNAPPVSAANQPPAAPAQVPPSAQADSGDAVRLILAATEDTWVQVSADGKNVFSGVLKGQETRNIEGQKNTRVLIGNAGGLQIEWNGRQIGTLGKRGEVREVLFTHDGYQLIQKPPRADEPPKDGQPVDTEST